MKPLAVVFSGAGLSADSGIKTFRAADGLWEEHRVEDVASPAGWARDRELVLRFYAERFENYRHCRPHAGHEALARLEDAYDVWHVTQNIDGLIERAGCSDVTHLHGRLDVAKCERHAEIFGDDPRYRCDYKTPIDRPVTSADACPACGLHLRPDVVWFGEAVAMDAARIERAVAEAALFLTVGTSGKVYPAASFLDWFAATPEKFIIDPDPLDRPGFGAIAGGAADELPRLVDRLLAR
ncbi:MAG: Sir2 family NAD-dependent protein deacetylase [Planctomycetota bacterium]